MSTMKTMSGLVGVLALGLLGVQAQAAIPKGDVSNESIVCNTVIGTAKIKPPLLFGGTATATSISLKG